MRATLPLFDLALLRSRTALLLIAALSILAPRPEARAGRDPVRLLEAWSRADPHSLERLDDELVRRTLADWVSLPPERRSEGDRALCAFAGRVTGPTSGAHERHLQAAIAGSLAARRAGGENGRFDARLIEEVALMGDAVGDQARIGACFALEGSRHPQTVRTLVALARDPSQDLRLAACRSLVGRPDPAASKGLLDATLGAPPDRVPLFEALLGTHLREMAAADRLDQAWSETLAERLAVHVLPRSLAADWRVAVRAVRLAPFVPPDRGGAALTEALRLWTEREEQRAEGDRTSGPGTRRMRFECASALAALTGRDLGPDPRRWQQFWHSVRSGAPLQVSPERGGGTASEFFGLRLESDSIAFVIDVSGSMDSRLFDPEGRYGSASTRATRYEVACTELLRMLSSARVPTDFRVILFSDRGRAWRPRAERADESNLESLARWLRRQHPDGGTNLSEGLDELVGDRSPDELEELDVDTVVVLCDGATTEGVVWAETWLARHNRTAELVFNCVQIGGAGALALSHLVEHTGGRMVRIDG